VDELGGDDGNGKRVGTVDQSFKLWEKLHLVGRTPNRCHFFR
jgi:hypothetical protein